IRLQCVHKWGLFFCRPSRKAVKTGPFQISPMLWIAAFPAGRFLNGSAQPQTIVPSDISTTVSQGQVQKKRSSFWIVMSWGLAVPIISFRRFLEAGPDDRSIHLQE